jgi:hypothetical protein
MKDLQLTEVIVTKMITGDWLLVTTIKDEVTEK